MGREVIDRILDEFRALDILPPGCVVDTNVILTGAVILVVYVDSEKHYYAKVTDKFDMENEYQGTRRAYAALPGHVAEPIAMRYIGNNQVLICRGIEHTPLKGSELTRPDRSLADQLFLLFERSLESFSSDHHVSPGASHFLNATEFPSATRLPAELFTFFDEVDNAITSRPAVLQHGDFTVNNIGKTDAGLVYFDWEDFGRVSAFGFDACMLIISTLGFEEARIKGFFSGAGSSVLYELADWVGEQLDITTQEFFAWFPYYILLNASLKRSYGDAVTSKNLKLAAALLS